MIAGFATRPSYPPGALTVIFLETAKPQVPINLLIVESLWRLRKQEGQCEETTFDLINID